MEIRESEVKLSLNFEVLILVGWARVTGWHSDTLASYCIDDGSLEQPYFESESESYVV